MDVSVMTMPEDAAQKAFKDYAEFVKMRTDDEYKAIRDGYKAMAEGNGVIDLHDVMKETGVDELGQPKLAIVRAHAKEVFFSRGADGNCVFSEERNPHTNARFSLTRLPAETFQPFVWQRDMETIDRPFRPRVLNGRAITPIIPPQYVPKFGLHNYHLLFEAVWVKEPPADPFLLKHLGGALYAVLAEWDLTPLEMAVIKGRL